MSQSSSTLIVRLTFLPLLLTVTSCAQSPEQQSSDPATFGVASVGGLPLPETIDALVADLDAIVVGTISVPGDEQIDYLPTPEGSPPPTDLPSYATYMQETVTDFTVTCLDSLYGSIPENETFVLRLNGHRSALPTEMATTFFGEPQANTEYLLLLRESPSTNLDFGYFPRFQVDDMIIVDDSTVTYSDGTEVPYAEGMTGAQFLTAVEEAIEELE